MHEYHTFHFQGQLVGLNSNAGFMARETEGLRMAFHSLLQEPWRMADKDHKVVPMKWDQERFDEAKGRKLRIGW